jgi:hypothetical protein
MFGQTVPVARDVVNGGRQRGAGLAPVEDRDPVAGFDEPPHKVRANEVRATDDQDPHGDLPASNQPASTPVTIGSTTTTARRPARSCRPCRAS